MFSLQRLWVVPLLVCLAGCETLGYYGQALRGQLALMQDARLIAEIRADPYTDPLVRSQLGLVQELTTFARTQLALEVSGQYSQYVDTGRPFVVWNVFAAEPYSLNPHTWCYPVVGCAAYRGYFAEKTAMDYASRLRESGLDTYVGGVAAYSTLGWVDDPVLNTFVFREEVRLAELIFHELAHQVLYVKGDTMFNESFATATAAEGVRKWLAWGGKSTLHEKYLEMREQRAVLANLVAVLREKLDGLYNSGLSVTLMESRKLMHIAEFRADYASAVDEWGGDSPFESWVAAPINNAKLNSVAAYNELVPGFEALLAESSGMSDFFSRCTELAELEFGQRRLQLSSNL